MRPRRAWPPDWRESHPADNITPDEILAGRAPAAVLEALGERRIYILALDDDDNPVTAIERRAEEIEAATGQYPAIVVDYVQLLSPDDAGTSV